MVVNKGNAAQAGIGMQVDGGFQIQLNQDEYPANDHHCVVTEGYDMTRETNGYGNGMTYLLDRPMQPTTRSVYNILRSDSRYSKFFNLANTAFSAEELAIIGLKDPSWTDKDEEWTAEQNKYRIFTNASGYNPAQDEKLVRFFNNYRYTIYVPTNEAMQAAYAAGLPTYEDISKFISDNTILPDDEDGEATMTPENQAKAQAMVNMLVNFVKYHFQDQAFYVDDCNYSGDFQTSCVDVVNNVYLTISMKQTPNAITVTDASGATQSVIEPYNVLARDSNFDKAVANTATSISNSSYAVLHQVAKPLVFMSDFSGRYDDQWATQSKAKAFLAKYRILK